jgi:hypothetical protein
VSIKSVILSSAGEWGGGGTEKYGFKNSSEDNIPCQLVRKYKYILFKNKRFSKIDKIITRVNKVSWFRIFLQVNQKRCKRQLKKLQKRLTKLSLL